MNIICSVIDCHGPEQIATNHARSNTSRCIERAIINCAGSNHADLITRECVCKASVSIQFLLQQGGAHFRPWRRRNIIMLPLNREQPAAAAIIELSDIYSPFSESTNYESARKHSSWRVRPNKFPDGDSKVNPPAILLHITSIHRIVLHAARCLLPTYQISCTSGTGLIKSHGRSNSSLRVFWAIT